MNGSGLPLALLVAVPVGLVAAVVLPRRLRYLVGVLGQALVSDLLLLALERLRGGRAMPVVVDGVSASGGGAGTSFFDAFLRGGMP